MVIFGSNGQDLVAETPFSLLALTRHPVEQHEEQWFARCRADYLRSFPLSLMEFLKLAFLLLLVGPKTNLTFTAASVLGWAVVMAMQISVRRKETLAGFDQVKALGYRHSVIRLRTFWWSASLLAALVLAPATSQQGLIALALAMMAIDGLSTLSLPHLALGSSIAGGLAMTLGLGYSQGLHAGAPAASALALAVFMHWSIYNLYYLFATRRIRTKRLSQAHETVQLLLNQYDDEGSDWLYEIDADGRIQNASVRFGTASGKSVEGLERQHLVELFNYDEHRQSLEQHLRRKQAFRNQTVSLNVEGEDRWWSISGRPVHGLNGECIGWRGFIADISATKAAEAKANFMAHYDPLTQLPNRSMFSASMERHLQRHEPGKVSGLITLNIDHFKAINERFGHSAADDLLKTIGSKIESVIRPADLVTRLGGDEFAILLRSLDSTDTAFTLAERLLAVVSGKIKIQGKMVPIGASIGLAFAPHDATTGEDLLRAADLALSDAKAKGRGIVSVFDAEMHGKMLDRRSLEIDLRSAIIRKELELHYQPLLDLESGHTTGYEALLRWNHPERGRVAPDLFIPIAEETGLIVEIGAWVLRTALAEAATWPDQLTVAVNLSPVQLRDNTLLALVVSALATSRVAPERLELEITETFMVQDSATALNTLHQLRKLGVRIALDDFGTGYSSLNYLRSFPFDKIKIDRCFVSELVQNKESQAIVRSVIALANELHMTITAEGVELDDQLKMLREGGCDQVQGWIYSKALPVEDLHFGVDGAQPRVGPQAVPDNVRYLNTGNGKAAKPRASRRKAG